MRMSELIKKLNEAHAKNWIDEDVIRVTMSRAEFSILTRDKLEEEFAASGGVSGAYELVNGKYADVAFTNGYCFACDTETPSIWGLHECLVCGQDHR
jgi:hypothetical protein